MPHDHKFRFGVQMSQARTRVEWVSAAKKAEDLGYSSVLIPDHFGDQLAPWPALMTVVEQTSLRVGTLVLDNDYRHPVVLAKEAATVDLLSEGRLELGIGAGWMRTDYEASGIVYDKPAVRVDRLEESLGILKQLLAGDTVTYQGEHYTITNHTERPGGAIRPHPPILIGGGGRRVLRLAGKHADIVGINFNLKGGEVSGSLGVDATVEATKQKVSWVAEGAGDRFDDIELSVLIFFPMLTDDRRGQAETFGPMFGLTTEQALEAPYALVGTVDEICEDLIKRREMYGISYVVIGSSGFEDLGPVVSRLTGT